MFKPLFNNLLTFSITVIQDKELTDQTRQNALELMATFAEQSPALCKKDPAYTNEMVTQCLSLMTDVGIDDDDASEWNASEDVSKKQLVSMLIPVVCQLPTNSPISDVDDLGILARSGMTSAWIRIVYRASVGVPRHRERQHPGGAYWLRSLSRSLY
jgi:hypothetical protein